MLNVMQLALGRRADYAIRATLDLARHHEGPRRKAREISEWTDVPASFLAQILAQLVRAGLVTSEAGPHGGYALTRPPAAISLLDVIHAVEGDPSPKECVLRGGPCRRDEVCAVHVPWFRAQQAMLAQLSSASFATIAAMDAELEAGTFVLPDDVAPPAEADRDKADPLRTSANGAAASN
jgi:Rrf2 family transcriptional regulator, iron-sulfur cluster assembly transcription factor